MERDFLGLAPKRKADLLTLGQEENGVRQDSVPEERQGMRQSFGNEGSLHSQFVSFLVSPPGKPGRTLHDSIPSSGFMTTSGMDSYDSAPELQSGLVQQKRPVEKRAGSYYVSTMYPQQKINTPSIWRPQATRNFPPLKQPGRSDMKNSHVQSRNITTPPNAICSTVIPQFLGGVTVNPPVPVPATSSSAAGSTNSRNALRYPAARAQLTIFFAGSVYVYDDVSPEKAQAIMLMAGNGSTSHSHFTTVPATQALAARRAISIPDDASNGNERSPTISFPVLPTSPCMHLQESDSKSCYIMDLMRPKAVDPFETSIRRLETHQVISSVGATTPTVFPSVAIPQARKASLARFLEKRRERMMTASPYAFGTRSPDHGKAASDSISSSAASAGSCLHLDINLLL